MNSDHMMSLYIFAIDETFTGSFNKTAFLEILGFTDTSRKMPILTNDVKLTGKQETVDMCKLAGDFKLITEHWSSPRNASFFGSLFGCIRISPSRIVKITYFDFTQWNQSFADFSCRGDKDIPSRYTKAIRKCYENMIDFVAKCSEPESSDVEISIFEIFSVVLVLSVAVYFIRTLFHFIVDSKVSHHVRNIATNN